MGPRTRKLEASESHGAGPSNKKLKTAMDDDYSMDLDYDPGHAIPTPKATPILKGRKRWLADVADMKQAVKAGLELDGLAVKGFRAGDEEGSVEFRVVHAGDTLTELSVQATDTSSYPNDHNYICYALDDVAPNLLPVVEAIGAYPSKPLDATLSRILRSLALALSGHAPDDEPASQPLEDDSGSEAGVEGYEDYDGDMFSSQGVHSDNSETTQALKRDFLDVVGAGYQPGILRFGADDFVLSISIPVLNLDVPSRALVAWDRRLLSASRHLVLLVSGLRARWPAIRADGTLVGVGGNIRFHVGLSAKYKPSTASVTQAVRTFALKDDDLEAEIELESEPVDPDLDPWEAELRAQQREKERIAALPVDENAFERFSLSSSLDSLLDHQFLPVVRLRLRFGLGWAGAEMLHLWSQKMQCKPEELFDQYKDDLVKADKEEHILGKKYNLPMDPIRERDDPSHLNLLLVAFCYLMRRLAMCTRYCLVCHRRIESEYEALKPYVCADKLCTYQYYSLNFGPSIEYEIEANTEVVDLLVSLTYVACYEGQMESGLPVGMGLRVALPATGIKGSSLPGWSAGMIAQPGAVNQAPGAAVPVITEIPKPGQDGLVDFDMLPLDYQRAAVVQLLDALPSIADMKKYLDKARGKGRVRLSKMDPSIPSAAWSVLRWAVASCTAYLEEILEEDDMVHNIDKTWRQFRFSVGAPDAEARFKANVDAAVKEDKNAKKFPSLYAFHGSPLRNWHSIIREGLQLKTPLHGRAYGHGVYFAKDGSISMGSYAARGSSKWKNSAMCPTACVALAEIVNLPQKFVSNNPYFVVAETSWIITRYLLVSTAGYSPTTYGLPAQPDTTNTSARPARHYVKLDPAHPVTLGQKPVQIPEQQQKLQRLVDMRREEQRELEYDAEDQAVFAAGDAPAAKSASTDKSQNPPPNLGPDWQHNEAWVNPDTYRLLPPPTDASSSATMAVQRELRAMLKEQQSAKRLEDLGWYMPESLMSDNLFQWMVEMHSFDPDLPLAKDMKDKGVNSLLFEIRFPSAFPHSPPFFRIIKPRLLPFIQGGGGHVTGGGSICMDLLVSDGWLPSYSISAILLQIKLAISNLDPRPARLASNWSVAYDVSEALEGYKRAARTHNWTVPPGVDKLVRY